MWFGACSLGQNSSSIVNPIVDINPQDDIIDNIKDKLGLGSLSDGSFTDKWYFWLIIAIVICIFIVLVYFTLRGFRKYLVYRKKMVGLDECCVNFITAMLLCLMWKRCTFPWFLMQLLYIEIIYQ